MGEQRLAHQQPVGRCGLRRKGWACLAAVLSRSKFDPYVTIGDRQEFIRLLGRVAERIPITYTVHAWRDPKDNMLLELAVNGSANLIVTGDQDLLVLRVYQEIPTITPAAYIAS